MEKLPVKGGRYTDIKHVMQMYKWRFSFGSAALTAQQNAKGS